MILIGLIIGGWVSLSLGMGLRLAVVPAPVAAFLWLLLLERSRIDRGVKGC